MTLSTSHKSIKVEGEDRISMTTDKTTIKSEIGHTVEIGIHLVEAEKILTEILDQIIEVDQELTIDGMDTDKMVGVMITDEITEETTIEIIVDKIMDEIIVENKGIEIEVQVGIIIGITIETIQRKDLSKVEIQVEIGVEKESCDHSLEWNKKIEEMVIDQEQSQNLDQVQELVQIGIGVGVISVESMIILQGNIPLLSQMKIQIMVT